MGLFSRTDQEKRNQTSSKNKKTLNVLGELSGLSHPFKNEDKNDLNRKGIIKKLDMYKKLPVRLLEEASIILKIINRIIVKPKQRNEFAEA